MTKSSPSWWCHSDAIMKFTSWNVNGLRAVINKGFADIFKDSDSDFFCLQEIKLQEGQADISFEGYNAYFNYAERKGYSGTAIFSRRQVLSATRGIGIDCHDHEGRVLTLDLGFAFLVNVYTPNSQDGLARLDYRLEWEKAFAEYVCGLDREKPVIICGDLNVAHKEIDLYSPKTNRRNPGFTDEEREAFSQLLDSGFTDTFRLLYPDKEKAYSWWSYRYRARDKNIGWRIDYFLVSDRLAPYVQAAEIHSDLYGSDHCPVSVTIDTGNIPEIITN